MRKMVIDHLQSTRLDKSVVESNLASHNGQWPTLMARNAYYVDQFFLLLAADLFKRDIIILPQNISRHTTFKGTKFEGLYAIRTMEPKETKRTPFYFLYDKSEIHYQSLRPKDETNPLVIPENLDTIHETFNLIEGSVKLTSL